MEYHALLDFIQTRMRMAHIYQPVMIRTLLDHRSEADDEQLAKNLLSHDRSQTQADSVSKALSYMIEELNNRLAQTSIEMKSDYNEVIFITKDEFKVVFFQDKKSLRGLAGSGSIVVQLVFLTKVDWLN